MRLMCGCGAGPVCALWAVEGHGGALVPHCDPRRAEPNGFWVTVNRYPSLVFVGGGVTHADVPGRVRGRTTEVGGALRTLDGMRDLTPQRGRAGGIAFRWIHTLSPPPDFPV